jgi:hypothetical protein
VRACIGNNGSQMATTDGSWRCRSLSQQPAGVCACVCVCIRTTVADMTADGSSVLSILDTPAGVCACACVRMGTSSDGDGWLASCRRSL